MIKVTTEEELLEVIQYSEKEGLRLHILGEGTNTFFGNELENLIVVKMNLKGIKQSKVTNDMLFLTIAAGENWDEVVRYAVDRNLWGIENLSLIPGTAGAAPVQNIGAYGVELKDVLQSVRVYDMKDKKSIELDNDACHFAYRDSLFKHEPGRYIILSLTLRLSTLSKPVFIYKPLDTLLDKKDLNIQDVRDLVVLTRMTKLPDYKQYPNAGSFFKNAVIGSEKAKELQAIYPDIPLHETDGGYKVPTAWLIEHVAQMKGVRYASLGTWPAQPLVMVNYDNATGIDLMEFSQTIINKIKEKTGIILEREVNFVI